MDDEESITPDQVIDHGTVNVPRTSTGGLKPRNQKAKGMQQRGGKLLRQNQRLGALNSNTQYERDNDIDSELIDHFEDPGTPNLRDTRHLEGLPQDYPHPVSSQVPPHVQRFHQVHGGRPKPTPYGQPTLHEYDEQCADFPDDYSVDYGKGKCCLP